MYERKLQYPFRNDANVEQAFKDAQLDTDLGITAPTKLLKVRFWTDLVHCTDLPHISLAGDLR